MQVRPGGYFHSPFGFRLAQHPLQQQQACHEFFLFNVTVSSNLVLVRLRLIVLASRTNSHRHAPLLHVRQNALCQPCPLLRLRSSVRDDSTQRDRLVPVKHGKDEYRLYVIRIGAGIRD